MSKVVCAYVCFIFSSASILNMLGAFLNVVVLLILLVIGLDLYLCVPVFSILVSLFGGFSNSGIKWFCASGVFTFIFSILIFGHLPFSQCNC